MRKTLVILFAVAVLGILATYVGPGVKKPSTNAAQSSQQTATASASPASGDTASSVVATPSLLTAETPAPTASTTRTTYKDGKYVGTLSSNRYGDVKVSLQISGGKITAVNLDVLNTYEDHSEEINAFAVPKLKQQTLNAQSANISGVSGATFTSSSYITSLQSALDKARSS